MASIHPIPRSEITCAWCNTIFVAHARNGKRKFCSKSCYVAWYARYTKQEEYLAPRRKGHNYASITGERCHLWKGGITAESIRQRQTPEYKAWRLAVWQRDYFRCQRCGVPSKKGKHGTNLIAHHIKPFADYPELRLEVSNGITLCRPCHNTIDDNLGQFNFWVYRWPHRVMRESKEVQAELPFQWSAEGQ